MKLSLLVAMRGVYVQPPTALCSVSRMLRLPLALLIAGLMVCVVSQAANAAVRLDSDTTGESLIVDSHGDAQVTFTSRGASKTVVVSGSTIRFGADGVSQSPTATRVTPTVPFALVQFRLSNGEQIALQRFHRTGQFGVLGPEELFLARWHGAPTSLTLVQTGDRICGTVTYHGRAAYGGAHTAAGNPLDALGRNIYLDALRPAGWYRLMGVLARPRGFALALTADRAGSRYRALVVGPNVMGDLAPVASATTPAHAPAGSASCPFPPGTYAGS
jgi:hypothetical protein